MFLRALPNLKSAVEQLCAANNMRVTNYDAVELPAHWRTLCCLADDEVCNISGLAISSFIPDNLINRDNHEPDDDCLEVLTDGEEETRKLLVQYAHCEELDMVLAQFFEGELRALLR